jgi:hypothetical protein
MRRWIPLACRSLLVLAIAIPLSGLDAQPSEGNPLWGTELAEFLGPAPSLMTWSRVIGPDCVFYYGHAKPPVSGAVIIYLGGYPPFETDPAAAKVEGRLGRFDVKWQKTTLRDKSIKQDAAISLDSYWKAHVVVKADNQTDADKLIDEISRLPTFTQTPKPVGVP